MANCKIACSINCMFLGWMMICMIEFMEYAMKRETWKGCELIEPLVFLMRLRGTGIISLIS